MDNNLNSPMNENIVLPNQQYHFVIVILKKLPLNSKLVYHRGFLYIFRNSYINEILFN
jgi:hypothetical protein